MTNLIVAAPHTFRLEVDETILGAPRFELLHAPVKCRCLAMTKHARDEDFLFQTYAKSKHGDGFLHHPRAVTLQIF